MKYLLMTAWFAVSVSSHANWPILADFNGEGPANNAGGMQSTGGDWEEGGEPTSGRPSIKIVKGENPYARFDWRVGPNEVLGYSYSYLSFGIPGGRDISAYPAFRLKVKGKDGGEHFKIVLKRASQDCAPGRNEAAFFVTTTTRVWQDLVIPMSYFHQYYGNACPLMDGNAVIDQVVISVEELGKGSLFLDDLQFSVAKEQPQVSVPLPYAGPKIDDFDTLATLTVAGGSTGPTHEGMEKCGTGENGKTSDAEWICRAKEGPDNSPHLRLKYKVVENAGCTYQYAAANFTLTSDQDISGWDGLRFWVQANNNETRFQLKLTTRLDPCTGGKNATRRELIANEEWDHMEVRFDSLVDTRENCPYGSGGNFERTHWISFIQDRPSEGWLAFDEIEFFRRTPVHEATDSIENVPEPAMVDM